VEFWDFGFLGCLGSILTVVGVFPCVFVGLVLVVALVGFSVVVWIGVAWV